MRQDTEGSKQNERSGFFAVTRENQERKSDGAEDDD
jgi:hypothetical protein